MGNEIPALKMIQFDLTEEKSEMNFSKMRLDERYPRTGKVDI
jgi:hypothetical protein